MASDEELLSRLRSGARVGWFGFARLAASRDPRLLEILLDLLKAATTLGEINVQAGRLAKLAGNPYWLERLAQRTDLSFLADVLGRIDARLDPMTSFIAATTTVQAMQSFSALFACLGIAVIEPARRLVEGPARGAIAMLEGESRTFVLAGPKIPAIATVAAHGGAADAARLAAVVADSREDPWTRADAAVAWHRFAGDNVASAVVEHCLNPELLDTDLFGCYAQRLAALGGCLVPLLLPYLDHPAYTLRSRARELLVALGETAKQPLAELVRTTEAWRVAENAEEALGRLDRRLLRQARRDRAADGRSISLTRPGSDAERGLSRAEEV